MQNLKMRSRKGSSLLKKQFQIKLILQGLKHLYELLDSYLSPFMGLNKNPAVHTNALTPAKSILFGIVFSISWTPCVSAFLGSALILASQQGSVLKGIIMLLLFSAGLAIPFIASAVLIDRLKSTFDFLKKHYKIINYVSGVLLILLGILMIAGRLL